MHRQMCRDERYFPDPDVFRPERFFGKVEGMKDTLHGLNGFSSDDPSSLIFGFGRRYVLTVRKEIVQGNLNLMISSEFVPVATLPMIRSGLWCQVFLPPSTSCLLAIRLVI